MTKSSSYPQTLSEIKGPLKRAEEAARILRHGQYDVYKKEFKNYLYPGPQNAHLVLEHLNEIVETNPDLALEIMKLGKTGEPFSPKYNRKTFEHDIFVSCIRALQKVMKDDQIRDMFVNLVYNPDGKRTIEDCQKLSAFLKDIQKKNDKSLCTVASEVLGARNWYIKQLKLEPVFDSVCDFFLYAKKKERSFANKKETYSLQEKSGYGVTEIMTGQATKLESHLLSIDYYHRNDLRDPEHLVASIDCTQNIVMLYDRNNKVSQMIADEYGKDERYAIARSTDKILYPGFNPLCKQFAKDHDVKAINVR